jgi:F-type H+-transporting ATPase subunit alpha
VLNLEEDNVGVVLLGPSTGIKEGSTAKRTQRIASLKVGEQMVGRVVNTLGFQLMERTNWWRLIRNAFEEKTPGLSSVSQLLSHYKQELKAVDAMIPVGRGQRELVIGDRQTGKSTVCIDTILNQKNFTMQETCILYICCNWTKASTVAGIAKMLEEKRCNGLYHYCLLMLLIQLDASLCSFRRCSNWRIF